MDVTTFREAVTQRVLDALGESAPFVDDAAAATLLEDFLAPARALSETGKRTRALLLAAGYQATSGTTDFPIHAGAAIELYQSSALVHDDLVDEADTRRGKPATHHAFAQQHKGHDLNGESSHFGEKAALLLGDYLLSLSITEFDNESIADATSHERARRIFRDMTTETAFGQFMDMRAEFTPLDADVNRAITSSLLVLRHKSARYSVELPLMIGGALGGGSDDDVARLSAIGRPLGEAFQLRDDELGIFGDPETTGKPAGGDITEGKRTVLLALTRAMATPGDVDVIDGTLGRELSDQDVAKIRDIITNSGASERHEEMIREREELARERQTFTSPLLDELMAMLGGRRS